MCGIRSMESRVPFLDVKFVEIVMSLPPEAKLKIRKTHLIEEYQL